MGGFPLSRVIFTYVTKIEAIYRTPCLDIEVERGLKYVGTRVKITRQWKSTLFHLRGYARENYKTAEIHPYS